MGRESLSNDTGGSAVSPSSGDGATASGAATRRGVLTGAAALAAGSGQVSKAQAAERAVPGPT